MSSEPSAQVVPFPAIVPGPEERPVLVLDFGGQYSQLIARRVREAHVYSELVSHRVSVDDVRARNPLAIVLSGGPASVYAEGAPQMDPSILALGVPTLGICYGMQLMARELGGAVESNDVSEYGKTSLEAGESALFRDLPPDQIVWMSHRDSVTAPPPGATVTASSLSTPIAAFEDRAAGAVRRAVPSRGRPHAARPGRARELPLRRRGRAAGVDAGRRDRGAGRARSGPRSDRSA